MSYVQKKSTTRRKGDTFQRTEQSELVSTTKYNLLSTSRQATRRPARATQPTPLPQNDKPIERIEFCCHNCGNRAVKLLKRYDVKVKLVPCSEQCQHYHTGVILSNPRSLDVEYLLLRAGFVHLSDNRQAGSDNGAFEIEYGS